MNDPAITCQVSRRRKKLIDAINRDSAKSPNGIDYVAVSETPAATDKGKHLNVFLFKSYNGTTEITADNIDIRDDLGQALEVHQARAYDRNISVSFKDELSSGTKYRLSLIDAAGRASREKSRPLAGFDPQCASIHFTWHKNSESLFDVVQRIPQPQPSRPEPELNYLARDFQSLRNVLLDRVATLIPEWRERHIADVYMTALELLANEGDLLAYKQDAVATEAYVESARRRESVRRHARLVNYRVHEGCNARTMLQLRVNEDVIIRPGDLSFMTQPSDGLPFQGSKLIAFTEIERLSEAEQQRFLRSVEVFEPVFEPVRSAEYRVDEFATDQMRDISKRIISSDPDDVDLKQLFDKGFIHTLNSHISGDVLTEEGKTLLLNELNRIIRDEYVPGSVPQGEVSAEIALALAACESLELTPDRRNRRNLDVLLKRHDPGLFDQFYALTKAHNAILIHTWDQDECWLPRGTTSATLASTESLSLKPGDLLLFEEVKGPKTGNPSDANPQHRHFVRISSIEKRKDLLDDDDSPTLYEITWSKEDALPFSLCLSSKSDCRLHSDVTVARGNIVLADHGRSTEYAGVDDELVVPGEVVAGCSEWETRLVSNRFQFTLPPAELTWAHEFVAANSASHWFRRSPEDALPAVELTGIPGQTNGSPAFVVRSHGTDFAREVGNGLPWEKPASSSAIRALSSLLPSELAFWFRAEGSTLAETAIDKKDAYEANPGEYVLANYFAPLPVRTAARHEGIVQRTIDQTLTDCVRLVVRDRTTWKPVFDLLNSEPTDRHFVVEMSNRRRATLRFGDDALGRKPKAGGQFFVRYRVGNGRAGNVGAGQIQVQMLRTSALTGKIQSVRNPLPASGGTDPQSVAEAKLICPFAYLEDQPRAISPADYERLTFKYFGDRIQAVKAIATPLAGRTRIALAVDPLADAGDTAQLLSEIRTKLSTFRSIGHIVDPVPPEYVPIRVCLTACVDSDFHTGSVRRDVSDLLSSRRLKDGTLGLFHPDRLTLGQDLYGGQILAAIHRIPGILSADFAEFRIVTEADKDTPYPQPATVPDILIGPLQIATVDHELAQVKIELRGGR